MSEESRDKIRRAASLESIGRDLTQLAWENQLKHIFERDEEIEKLVKLLSTIEMNVILVGNPGVGKNAIIAGLAKWMTFRNKHITPKQKMAVGPNLINMRIIETSAEAFQHECYYVHEFENKLKFIVEECKKNKAILFLDNINMAIGAGSTGQNPERTLANLLNRYLSSKEILIIGATSNEGYEMMIKYNPEFTNRFIKMEIPATTLDQTRELLFYLKDKFEQKYEILIDERSFDAILDISERFFTEKSFPGKACDLLFEAIAETVSTTRTLKTDNIYKMTRIKTGFPESIIYRNQTITKESIIDFFQERLFGQDHAIEAITDSILTFKSELNDPHKPINTFLFIGPTGVGKTELAKLLAEYLFGSQSRLHKYDMSHYADDRGIIRLIEGSKHFNEPGKLFSETIANPFCVTLFDEIEKANTEVFNFLLPILDEGQLVDRIGRVAYFYNSIIIMTSNLGSDLYQKKPINLAPISVDVSEEDIFKKLKERFSPEFINRIGHIIYFKPLSKDSVLKIVHKELDEIFVRSGLNWRGIHVDVDEKVIELVIKKAQSDDYGARAIQRSVKEVIVYPMAERLSSDTNMCNKKIKITLKDGKVSLKYRKANTKR